MSANTVVRTNVLSLNSHRNLGMVARQQAQASSRLSSGFRINSAADDAAGLAISEKMRAQIRGLDQASRNAQDGISFLQVAEGALNTINEMIVRIRELTVQAANDTYTYTSGGTNGGIAAGTVPPETGGGVDVAASDREKIMLEIQQLIDEIRATSERVEFNTMTQLNGSISAVHLQIGANNGNGVVIQWNAFADILNSVAADMGTIFGFAANDVVEGNLTLTDTNVGFYGLGGEDIAELLDDIDRVLADVTMARAHMGAWMNRLEYTIENLDLASENLSAAESRIRDADMAQEMMRLTQANVLQQAAISMLAQANQAPQSVLQLLG